MDQTTTRFISAFNKIEDFLTKLCGFRTHTPFYGLVDEGARKNPAVKRYAFELKELGDLRNAIMHGYTDDRPLATPYPETVSTIEAITDRLLAPPLLLPTFRRKVYACSPDAKIGPVLTTMFAEDYSQVPVYEDWRFVGLLNTATITRWLASRIEKEAIMEEEPPISAILKHALPVRRHDFCDERATVFEALKKFEDAFKAGNELDAIIITAHGKGHQPPLGILTIFDIPKLQDLAAVRKE